MEPIYEELVCSNGAKCVAYINHEALQECKANNRKAAQLVHYILYTYTYPLDTKVKYGYWNLLYFASARCFHLFAMLTSTCLSVKKSFLTCCNVYCKFCGCSSANFFNLKILKELIMMDCLFLCICKSLLGHKQQFTQKQYSKADPIHLCAIIKEANFFVQGWLLSRHRHHTNIYSALHG